MAANSINLLVVDDHKIFRRALVTLIKTFQLITNSHEAANGKEALLVLAANPIDLILLDVQMPEMGGIEMLKQLRHDGLSTKVLILTQFDDESLIVYLLQIGANGFLSKTCDPAELQNAISEISTNGSYFDRHVLQAIEHNLSREPRLSKLDISPREFQVLVLLKEGQSNKEIARNLGLRIRTIESYRKCLIKKTNSKNTVGLVSLAYRTGILPK